MTANLIKSAVLILVSILSVKYILFWTYIWQLKEYRWDRLKDFLNSSEGRKAFFNIFYLGKAILVILLFFICLQAFSESDFSNFSHGFDLWGWLLNFIFIIIFLLFLFEIIIFFRRIYQKRFIKPVAFTKKALLLLFTSLIINSYLIIFLYQSFEEYLFTAFSLVVLLFIPLFSVLANIFIFPLSYVLKKQRIKKASRLMQSFDGTVIGITGSYGKSSVKEYCAGLLGQKFDLIKTPKNVNTEIGVANCIISLKSKVKSQKLRNCFFICEMGAYRIKEIKKLCDMAKPKIGILTGINEQHIALFGNIENTIKAKSELIQSLPKGGVAIINNDDKNCRSVSIPEGVKKITYGFNFDSDVQLLEIRNLKFEIGTMEMVIKTGGIDKTMRLNAPNKHSALNILPAIAVAKEAGMSLDEIKKAVENLEPPENGMKIKTLGKAVIIDDTYNSNPTGVRAALEVLDGVNKPNKILVLDDIWELGKESERIHRELAKIISEKKYNKIILTGKNYAEFMKNELIKNGISRDNIAAEIILNNYITIDSAILFEGRMSKKFLIHLISNSPNKN